MLCGCFRAGGMLCRFPASRGPSRITAASRDARTPTYCPTRVRNQSVPSRMREEMRNVFTTAFVLLIDVERELFLVANGVDASKQDMFDCEVIDIAESDTTLSHRYAKLAVELLNRQRLADEKHKLPWRTMTPRFPM